MKIRSGFVSNSSSSSFIVGIGKVADLDKLRAYFKEHGIKVDNLDVTLAKVKDLDNVYGIMQITEEKVAVDSFQSRAEIRMKGLAPNDTLVIVNIVNNEGDTGVFAWDENNDINYDIDIDYFDKTQQAIYYMFDNKNSGVDVNTSDVRYGAGRNG